MDLFGNTSNETLERHARLLADWTLRKDKNGDRKKLCSQLAQQLMLAVEQWDPKRPREDYRARRVDRSELLSLLVQVFVAVDDQDLVERLVSYVLRQPKEFDLTTVQVPALLGQEAWLKRNLKHSSPPLQRWLTAIVNELDDRRAHPPQEPMDWRRDSATGCNCADCKELSRFLENPNTPTLRLPLAEKRRQHLHHVIDGKKLDTTHTTDGRGSPYTLVCTKTKASFERALKAHQVDLDQVQKMRILLKWHGGQTHERIPIHRLPSRRQTGQW